jgi:TRAP-type uncharacterized transport system substrate-binding protein
MKKLVLTGFVLAIFVAVTVIFSVDGHCKEKYKLTIATGGTGGTYYPCGGGVGELLRKKVDIISKRPYSLFYPWAHLSLGRWKGQWHQ